MREFSKLTKNKINIQKSKMTDLSQWVKDPALPRAIVQVAEATWIWSCCGCGIDQQLQLQFDPQPGNFICRRCGPEKKIIIIIIQRRCMNVANSHERTLDITNHQGNANENDDEIPPEIHQNGYQQQKKISKQVLANMGCAVGGNIKIVQLLWKTVWWFPQKNQKQN